MSSHSQGVNLHFDYIYKNHKIYEIANKMTLIRTLYK